MQKVSVELQLDFNILTMKQLIKITLVLTQLSYKEEAEVEPNLRGLYDSQLNVPWTIEAIILSITLPSSVIESIQTPHTHTSLMEDH